MRRCTAIDAVFVVLLLLVSGCLVFVFCSSVSKVAALAFPAPKAPVSVMFCAKDPWMAGPLFVPCRNLRTEVGV